MSTDAPKVALVTGASSGIGAAVATELSDNGWIVYAMSRKFDRPQSGSPRTTPRPLDVRDEAAINGLVAEVIGTAGRIDLLVNNAGVALAGALEETSIAEAKDLFETNFFGAVRMTMAVLPHMRAAHRGRLVFISSVLGFLPAPFMGIYGASKHAVEGYSETLDHEVRDFGVRSILVEPSFTATGLVRNQQETMQRLPVYAALRTRVLQRFAENTERGTHPEEVAKTVLEAATAESPKLRYPVNRAAKSVSWLRRFVPPRMFEKSFRHQSLLDT